jgi:hypothetical protein
MYAPVLATSLVSAVAAMPPPAAWIKRLMKSPVQQSQTLEGREGKGGQAGQTKVRASRGSQEGETY